MKILAGLTLALLVSTTPAFAAQASVFLEELTTVEIATAVREGRTTIIIPVGGVEQNGPHMALGKHNQRVKVLAGRIAQQLGNAIVAPVVAYVPEGKTVPTSWIFALEPALTVPTVQTPVAGTYAPCDGVLETSV